MRKYWYKKILIGVLIVTTFAGTGFYGQRYYEENQKKEVSTGDISEDTVLLGGMPVGIYMEMDGVMILDTEHIKGTDGVEYEPASHLVKAGDYITAFNGTKIESKFELTEALKQLSGDEVILQLRRDEEELEVKVKPVEYNTNEYKLGIWVRDNVQGLGTITFLDGNSQFGALGHGIHDVDTDALLEIESGKLYETSIRSIAKGTNGNPGSMEGIIVYNSYNELGNITQNTEAGIYGTVEKIDKLFLEQRPIQIAKKEEIEVGPATICCFVENEVREYEIEVTGIDYFTKEINKGIVIQVTDSGLLEKTGGIIQGMSGSPIIQNDKIIGAVTHVFVQDATKGYGIFIENMIQNVK